ncbi:MAG: methionine synthase [Methanosphaera sp.]|nr:methionine synthase [Methanosphaera sp.]
MSIITTVVGSYPTQTYEAQSFNDKLTKSLGLYDPYRQAIIDSVKSFVSADIDIICDGQVRGDMVKIFTSKINGCEVIDNTVYIKGKITPPVHPISVNDLKLAYKTANSVNSDYELFAPLDAIFDHEVKGIKGVITGPTTLIHSSMIDNFYSSKENAIYDMAKVLRIEAQELEKAGACAIQLDEPFISTGAEEINVSKKAIEIISEAIDIPVILHVCGDLKDVLSDLLKFNVDILDFEFKGMPQNKGVLSDSWSNECNKNIGIGCLDTKMPSVDDYSQVKETIKEVQSIIERENIIIDPDCGMRMLEEDVARGKLDILKKIKEDGI